MRRTLPSAFAAAGYIEIRRPDAGIIIQLCILLLGQQPLRLLCFLNRSIVNGRSRGGFDSRKADKVINFEPQGRKMATTTEKSAFVRSRYHTRAGQRRQNFIADFQITRTGMPQEDQPITA